MNAEASSRELLALLHTLSNTDSEWERMRALAKGWKLLQTLSPSERNKVLMHAGVQQAEGLLTHLSEQHGEGPLPPEVHQLLGLLEDADPKEAQAFLLALRDPAQREGLMRAALEQASQVASTSAEPPASTPTAPPPPPPAAPPVASAPKVGAAPPPKELVVSEPPKAKPSPPPKREVRANSQTKTPVEAKVEVVAVTASTEATALVERLRAQRSLLDRLQMLRREVSHTSGADDELLRALLTLFPSGWSRGRALRTLLEHGVPKELFTAMALVELVGSKASERFCLSLLSRRALSDQETHALSVRAPWLAQRTNSHATR